MLLDDYDILLTQPGFIKLHDFKKISLEAANNYIQTTTSLRIAAQLGNFCTYKCTYCTPADYDGSQPWPEDEKFKKLCQLVDLIDNTYKNPPHNKQHIIWELLGGEITVWKNVERFIEYLTSKGHHIQLITNGVRTERWWKQYGKLFKHVTLSYHPESADYRHITNIGNILQTQEIAVGGLIMMYPNKWDTVLEAIKYMQDNAKFSVLAKKLHVRNHDSFGKWSYTAEQETFIENVVIKKEDYKINKKENITHYSTLLLKRLSDGDIVSDIVDIQDLINSDRNNWRGWKCNIGIDTLYINPKGDVKIAAQCFIDEGCLFNWMGDSINNWKFPTKSKICVYDSCHCTHDIRARKEKNVD